MSKRKAKFRYKMLDPHNPAENYHDWVLGEGQWLQRDTLFRRTTRRFGNRFIVFRCNNTNCNARMAVLENDVADMLPIGVTRWERQGT